MNKLFEVIARIFSYMPEGGFRGPLAPLLYLLAALSMPIQIIIELFR